MSHKGAWPAVLLSALLMILDHEKGQLFKNLVLGSNGVEKKNVSHFKVIPI